MAFTVTGVSGYKDQVSFDLISQAVAGAHVMDYATIRTGLAAGTVSINLLSSTLNPSTQACSWSDGGSATFTQVDMRVVDFQVKESYCPQDLRDTWVSSKLNGGAHQESIPFEEAIGELKAKQIAEKIETYVFQGYAGGAGGATITGLLADVTIANGAADGRTTAVGGTWGTAWSGTTALTYAIGACNAVPSAVADRPDLTMYMSYKMYRFLMADMVSKNLFHYTPTTSVGDGFMNGLVIPGTNVKAVPFTGMGTSTQILIGPSSELIVGTALEGDFEQFNLFFDPYNDIVKFLAKWRLGVKVPFVANWVSNA